MLGRDSEDEIWSRFVFEFVIWPQEVTLVRWTQSSGPLCLWQCLVNSILYQFYVKMPLRNLYFSNMGFNPYPPFQNFSYWWYRRQGQPLGPHGNKLRWCSGTWRESIKTSLSNPGPKLHHLQQHIDQHVPTSPPLLASRVPDGQLDWIATALNDLRFFCDIVVQTT